MSPEDIFTEDDKAFTNRLLPIPFVAGGLSLLYSALQFQPSRGIVPSAVFWAAFQAAGIFATGFVSLAFLLAHRWISREEP